MSDQGGLYRATVDYDCVGWANGITPREGYGYSDARFGCCVQDEFVSFSQPLDAQRKSAELIRLVWIGAGEVDDELRLVFLEYPRQVLSESLHVLFVSYAVVEPYIQISGGFDRRIVPLVMHGESEDTCLLGEDRRCAVAVMDIEVDDEDSVHFLGLDQTGRSDRDIIE